MTGLYRCGCDLSYTWEIHDGMFPGLIWECRIHNEPPYFFEPYRSGKEITREFSAGIADVIISEQPLMRYLRFREKPVHERIKIMAGELITRLQQL